MRAPTIDRNVIPGLELALEHIKSQHVVWDLTEIPPKVLLDMIERNLRALIERKD